MSVISLRDKKRLGIKVPVKKTRWQRLCAWTVYRLPGFVYRWLYPSKQVDSVHYDPKLYRRKR